MSHLPKVISKYISISIGLSYLYYKTEKLTKKRDEADEYELFGNQLQNYFPKLRV